MDLVSWRRPNIGHRTGIIHFFPVGCYISQNINFFLVHFRQFFFVWGVWVRDDQCTLQYV